MKKDNSKDKKKDEHREWPHRGMRTETHKKNKSKNKK